MADDYTLEFESGLELDEVISYSHDQSFGEVCDIFTFTMADTTNGNIRKLIDINEIVKFSINGCTRFTGKIESVDTRTTREGGLEYTFNCRDLFGQMADSYIEPSMNITEKDTLESALFRLFTDYGFTQFVFDDTANRNIISGQKIGFTAKGKTAKSRQNSLKKHINHQTKPNKSEGVFEFAHRLTARFGLHIWLSADGVTVYVGVPDFDQEPIYAIYNILDPERLHSNNVINNTLSLNFGKQMSMIIAECKSGGNASRQETNKVVMINELGGLSRTNNKPIASVQSKVDELKSKGAKILDLRDGLIREIPKSMFGLKDPQNRPFYLYDNDSKTIEELEFATRRKMSELQKNFLTLRYTVSGHSNSLIKQDNAIYTVNTMASVIDEQLGIDGNYWISKVNVKSGRQDGQTTTLDLILPYSMDF